MNRRTFTIAAAALALAACADQDTLGPGTRNDDTTPNFSADANEPGAVYTMTNAVAGNTVVRFGRAADGTLGAPTTFATGGTGSGAALGTQGSVLLANNGRWLFAVNPGSNDVSVFRVSGAGLELTDREASGGTMPVSITKDGALVYVLNAGGTGNISGFLFSPDGQLTPLAGSTRPLSGAGTGPAQVSFSPDGAWLVVTEKNTNQILTYPIDANGLAGAPIVHPSAGVTPFGFAFAGRRTLLITEAFGGAPNASAVSSYRLSAAGLQVHDPSVPTTETAACWAVVLKTGRYFYVTNTGSGTITGYKFVDDDALMILDANGVTATTGGAPSDIDDSVNSRFVYALNGAGYISGFAVAADGSLTPVNTVSGLPTSAAGLAAH